jgi:hypothetical protein
MEALGVRGCIAPTHSWPRHQMEVSCQRHTLAALYPRGKDPCTHWIGGWMGPRTGLDTEAKGKNPLPVPGIETRSPGLAVRSQILYWLSYCGFEKQLKVITNVIMYVRFHVLTAVSTKIVAFWDIAPWSLVEIDRRFRGEYCLHHRGDRPDDGGSTHLWNVGLLQRDYTALCPRRPSS